jgi:hypothetical protein
MNMGYGPGLDGIAERIVEKIGILGTFFTCVGIMLLFVFTMICFGITLIYVLLQGLL